MVFLRKYERSIALSCKKSIRTLCDILLTKRSDYYINRKSIKKVRERKGIKVGFIVQMPEIWDKQETIYNTMLDDPIFSAYLIIIPSCNFVGRNSIEYGDELQFFKSKSNGNNFIKTRINKRWIDIKSEKFDYLFYQRPYDYLLPRLYQSKRMVKFSKICYIPYATPEIKNTIIYPPYFFRSIYFGFMEDEAAAKKNNLSYPHRNHISFYGIGYPVFERCISIKTECKYSCVLWTPRWSYEPIIGGSHFFEYYEKLTDFKWKDKKLIIRPHPMMWNNFERNGLLSSDKIFSIKKNWEEKQFIIDENSNIEDTFQYTDIMISDKSSVIPMFFLTGKPIIYCPISCEYGSLFSSILPGLYIAESWQELKTHLQNLLEGIDPLKEIRLKIICNEFHRNANATNSIIDVIRKDYATSL